ncbi:hypothetical protein K1719_030504 [Acacia pycnantha]|nr:hypothetical protein K1719_030504 [Acacia pycnantha]
MGTEGGSDGNKLAMEVTETGKRWKRRLGSSDAVFTGKISNPPRLEEWMRDTDDGNSIGKVLKLDVHTASRGRNKFARVCIELDLTKPLVPHYMVDGVLKQVEYESLHALCLNCGLFGHFKESCVHGKKGSSEVEKVVLEGSDGIEECEIAENSKQASGPWKVVQRLCRQRKDRPMNEDMKIASRYDVLNIGEKPGQGDIAAGRGAAMEENIGRQFIKRRDRGLRKPVSIVNENGPHTEATIVPIGSQQRSVQGERSKQEGRMGPNKAKLTIPVPEYRGEGNGQDAWIQGRASDRTLNAWLRDKNNELQICFSHILREGNTVADWLAKHSLICNDEFTILDSPLVGVVDFLFRDTVGVVYPRLNPG